MSITTAIIITVAGLVLYYCFQIGYDLYLDSLAQANKDEDKEKAIDISGQVEGFESVPVNNQKVEESVFRKFQHVLSLGVSAEKMNRMANSIAEGSDVRELKNMLFAIQNYEIEQ